MNEYIRNAKFRKNLVKCKQLFHSDFFIEKN